MPVSSGASFHRGWVEWTALTPALSPEERVREAGRRHDADHSPRSRATWERRHLAGRCGDERRHAGETPALPEVTGQEISTAASRGFDDLGRKQSAGLEYTLADDAPPSPRGLTIAHKSGVMFCQSQRDCII